MSAMNETTDAAISSVLRSTLIIGALATAVGALVAAPRVALALGLGAALGAANLWVIARVVYGFLAPNRRRARWVLIALVKFSALFAGLYVIVISGRLPALPLALGYASLPLGIVVSQVFGGSSVEGNG
jgi:hypothetical protein